MNNTKYRLLKIYTITLPSLVYLTSVAYAVVTDYRLPGQIESQGPPGFVASFYNFALIISGILAFGAIVYGGVKYIFAAGNPSGQSEGKEWVKSALLGLLLLAGASLILRTINPDIVQLRLSPLESASEGGASGEW